MCCLSDLVENVEYMTELPVMQKVLQSAIQEFKPVQLGLAVHGPRPSTLVCNNNCLKSPGDRDVSILSIKRSVAGQAWLDGLAVRHLRSQSKRKVYDLEAAHRKEGIMVMACVAIPKTENRVRHMANACCHDASTNEGIICLGWKETPKNLDRCLAVMVETAKDLGPLLRVVCKDLAKDVELAFLKPRSRTRSSCVMYERNLHLMYAGAPAQFWPFSTGESHLQVPQTSVA
eukprot:jgi/Botrbrau1/14922/Bobra.0018s0026.1